MSIGINQRRMEELWMAQINTDRIDIVTMQSNKIDVAEYLTML